MRITEALKNDKVTISYEVFPPKTTAGFESVRDASFEIANLQPSYISVTYGAGGSTRANTAELAYEIQEAKDVPVLAHLTCVGASKEDIHEVLDDLKAKGIQNILALRGDRPQEWDGDPFANYAHASELVKEIKAYGDFCVGGACYPEGHTDAVNKAEDIAHLKEKVEAGCEFLTTQMFFDNNIFFNFLYRIREKGITVPVIPGIMPITKANQVKRAIELSGTNIPERFRNLVDWFGEEPEKMEQAGIAYATDQIIDLIANGIKHIHVYSMNKPEVAAAIHNNLSKILG